MKSKKEIWGFIEGLPSLHDQGRGLILSTTNN